MAPAGGEVLHPRGPQARAHRGADAHPSLAGPGSLPPVRHPNLGHAQASWSRWQAQYERSASGLVRDGQLER